MLNAGYPFRYLLRMIDRELSMVHSEEHLNVSVGVEGAQVPGLRFGHEGLSGSVPKMDISPLNGLQFVGINILVSVANRRSRSERSEDARDIRRRGTLGAEPLIR